MTSSEHEVHYLDHGGGGYNYGVPSSEVTGGRPQITPKLKRKRTESSRIKVCVRKRPLSKREEKREKDVVEVDDDGRGLLVKEEKLAVDLRKVWLVHKFQFDEVFGEDISNKGVYERTAKLFLPFVLKGGKATCFAFGQTGAGKTHTLLGDRNGKGLYQYAAEDLFEYLRAEAECDGVVVWISYFEIYCGQLYDLLNKRERIQALENGKHQVCITGVNEVPVNGPQTLNQFIEQGNHLRSQGSSGVNTSSSRSHAVLQMQLKDVTGNKLGRLSFIDLAGSERACDRGEPDKTTRLEGAEINTSLLALKECIRAMDQEHTHTPFRQSKLTQVLRDSFVGQSLTCMVASISPGSSALEHTLNTLRYADRVKEIHKLAYNSHQFSSAPKNFTPNNTSTPLKPHKNLRPTSSTTRRTSLPAQNLHTVSTPDAVVKRRSSMQTNSPRSHGTLEVGSETKRSPRRKVKQKTKTNVTVDGKEVDKNHLNENQSSCERIGRRNPAEMSPAIHREVVGEEAGKLRSNVLRPSHHQEKDDTTASSMMEEMKETNTHKTDEERVLIEKGIDEKKISGDSGLVEEQNENMRRHKMVRNFLSNSLRVWEDEKVIEKAVPSPNLSIGWEIENPHYVEVKESVRDEGEKGEQDLNNNSKEFDVMRFENPRYVGRKSNPQFEFTVAEDKYEEGRNVESNQNFQSLTNHFAREAVFGYVARDNGRSPGDGQKKEEREGAGSPRSIATDSTLELLAEIDQSLRNSSVSPVPDLARRYTMDGVTHDDLLRDVNRLTVSSSFTKRVTMSTQYQESVKKTKMKKRKENLTHQGGEMSSKVISEIEKMNRGSPLRVSLKGKGTEGNKDETEGKDIKRKEPVGKPADVERSEKRLGKNEGRRQSRNGPFGDNGGGENKNSRERKDGKSKVEGKVGEMQEGYERQRKNAGWEMKEHYVLEDGDVGVSHEPTRGTINASAKSELGSYSPTNQYEGKRNETKVLQYHAPHLKTNNGEGKVDDGGGGLKTDVDTSTAKEMEGRSVGVLLNGYDKEYSGSINQGMGVHRGPHRSDRICEGDTMVQNLLSGTEDYTMHKKRSRLGLNKEGGIDNGIIDSREFEVREGEGSDMFVRQNNSHNHKRRHVNGSNSKGHYKDTSEESGIEGVVEVSSGRLHSKHGVQDQEQTTNQLHVKNNLSKHERRQKAPADKSVDKMGGSESRSTQNDLEPKGNELLIVQGPRFSKEGDLGEEVVSENDKDLKFSHNFHSNGDWCECCSVLEQKQLWNREGVEKQEEEMRERLGLKEHKVVDQHRRASLNQGSESPSRRRRNLKQRNSLPWVGAPRFTDQEDLSGREGGTESVEYVMRRVQTDGQDGRKGCDHSANMINSFSKLPESGKESKTVGPPDRQQLPKKRASLAKESVKAGERVFVKDERHVSFEDVPKRGLEVEEQQHHSPPSVLMSSDEKHRKSPRSSEKEKPLSPDLSVYSTGGYIPTVFAVAQNNEGMAQVNNSLGKSGKKKRKSLKEKMSEKGIESLPSPKAFPGKTEMTKFFDKDISRNEVSHTDISSNSKSVTTWAESAERRQRSDRKEERESFFLKDLENEDPMTPGSQSRESVHQQVAFYRETYQPLSNQWQHVRNDGRSPVVKVKLSSSSVSRDSDEDGKGDGVLMDTSNVTAVTIITKNLTDNQNVSKLTQQENGWIHSRRRLEETEYYVDGATDRMVENNFGKDQGGQGTRDESVTCQSLDVVEVERVQFRTEGEGEDSRKFEERDNVSRKRNEKELLERKVEETGCKERTNVVTEMDGDEDVREEFSERQGGYVSLVEKSENATQQMVGVGNLDIESSWVGHQPLSPIPEGRSDEDDEVRGRLTNGAKEESPTQGDHIRPNSALEKATEHRNLSRDMILKDRHLLVRAHQEQLEELQQLCDSGWNLINKLQLGQGDVYEYLSDSDVLLDSQERCIKTFKDQLAMYTSCSSPVGMVMNGVVEHGNRRS